MVLYYYLHPFNYPFELDQDNKKNSKIALEVSLYPKLSKENVPFLGVRR